MLKLSPPPPIHQPSAFSEKDNPSARTTLLQKEEKLPTGYVYVQAGSLPFWVVVTLYLIVVIYSFTISSHKLYIISLKTTIPQEGLGSPLSCIPRRC